MKLIQGQNMFDYAGLDHVYVTTNGVLKDNGALIMGGGAAKEALQRFPGIDFVFGNAIRSSRVFAVKSREQVPSYGALHYVYKAPSYFVSPFQTKYHWRDAADLNLIRYACQRIDEYYSFARSAVRRPDIVGLNFPGIGLGKLENERDAILSIIEENCQSMGDNLLVFEL